MRPITPLQPVKSFPPLAKATARVLVLGSMPGAKSLQQQQYYAHPRNAFWYIMARLFGFELNADYATRAACLIAQEVAVWDVLASCQRQGSLDASIQASTEQANDFNQFFQQHPDIRWVFFNGSKAQQAYQTHVMKQHTDAPLHYHRLPSTSPAMAMLSKEQKYAEWCLLREKLN